MKPLKFVLVATVGVLLAGCAATATVPESARTFTAEELHAYLAGYTQVWEGNGGAYHADDGSFDSMWKGERVEGTWTVSDSGELCWHAEAWGEAGTSDNPCETYWLDGEAVIIIYAGETFPAHERREGNVVDDL